jgi:hypothetical protein
MPEVPEKFGAANHTTWMDRATTLWHENKDAGSGDGYGFAALLHRLHRANYDLWHEEDKARDESGGDADVAAAKRSIDRVNQQRNDTVEQIDQLLLEVLQQAGLPESSATLHSETPGMILDRLSILSLKLYHTREEIHRNDAPDGHSDRNSERFALLTQQREDLAHALDQLWEDIVAHRRRFKLYRQLKMYNDPSLNPVLYRERP